MKKSLLLTVGIFILVLAGAGIFGYYFISAKPNGDSVISKDKDPQASVNASSSDASIDSFVKDNAIGYRTKENLPLFPSDYKVINSSKFIKDSTSPETKKRLEDRFNVVISDIDKTPDSVELWVSLGNIKKSFEDYEGARNAWEYASLIRPGGATSYVNLGDLYWHFLPNYPKAEFNYKKAIENSPQSIGIYKDLSDMYRYDYKEKSQMADDILFDGLSQNPNNVSILIWLAGYYRDTGNKTKAIEYFEKAFKIEPDNAAIKREIEDLK